MRGALRSLRSLVFGETWIIPAGVVCALALALMARAAIPDDLWKDGGGFILAGFVVATLVLSLRLWR